MEDKISRGQGQGFEECQTATETFKLKIFTNLRQPLVQTSSCASFSSSHHDDEHHHHGNRVAGSWSSSSDETDGFRKASPHKREKRKAPELRPQAQESQYETGYTTGDTGNELDQGGSEHLFR